MKANYNELQNLSLANREGETASRITRYSRKEWFIL